MISLEAISQSTREVRRVLTREQQWEGTGTSGLREVVDSCWPSREARLEAPVLHIIQPSVHGLGSGELRPDSVQSLYRGAQMWCRRCADQGRDPAWKGP